MIFRKATTKDRSRLIELRMEFLMEANGGPYEFENRLSDKISSYFNRHIKDESFIAWLCINQDEIVGTSGISFYEVPPSYNNPNGKVGYIMNMYTHKAFRRQGVATVLFEKMLEEGRRGNVGKFVLHATKDGQALYKKYGFVLSKDEMILTLKYSSENETIPVSRSHKEELDRRLEKNRDSIGKLLSLDDLKTRIEHRKCPGPKKY